MATTAPGSGSEESFEVAAAVVGAVDDWDILEVLVVCVLVLMIDVVVSGSAYRQVWSLAKFSFSQVLWNKCRNTWECSILNYSLTGSGRILIWQDWLFILDLIHSIWKQLVVTPGSGSEETFEVAVAVVGTVVDWDLFKVLVVCVVVLMSSVVLSGPGYARIWSLAKFCFSVSLK